MFSELSDRTRPVKRMGGCLTRCFRDTAADVGLEDLFQAGYDQDWTAFTVKGDEDPLHRAGATPAEKPGRQG